MKYRVLEKVERGIIKVAIIQMENGETFVMKKNFLVKDITNLREQKYFENISLIKHPGILKLKFWDKNFLLYEYRPNTIQLSSLKRVLKFYRDKIPLGTILYIFKRVVETCSYLHQIDIVHGSICLENILIDNFGNILLSDTALSHRSNYVNDDKEIREKFPSPFNPEKRFSKKTDIFSIGVLLFYLFTSDFEIPEELYKTYLLSPGEYVRSINPILSDIIRNCIKYKIDLKEILDLKMVWNFDEYKEKNRLGLLIYSLFGGSITDVKKNFYFELSRQIIAKETNLIANVLKNSLVINESDNNIEEVYFRKKESKVNLPYEKVDNELVLSTDKEHYVSLNIKEQQINYTPGIELKYKKSISAFNKILVDGEKNG